uniref:BED-type domain-containing protein n=1 Tax=Panagrolaimus sp. PS1159 TaxID=55785 RepID=A0AC35GMN2_9BILA
MYPSTSYRKYWPKYKDGNPVWNFFHFDNFRSFYPKCNECGSSISRGYGKPNTTNMARHLECRHPILHEELLELRKMAWNPPPSPVTIVTEDVIDIKDSESENEKHEDEFFDATDDYVDANESIDGNKAADETGDQISTALQIYKTPTAVEFSGNKDTNMCNIPPSITPHSLHSNTQQGSQETNSTKPNVSMSKEELEKRLLIAQIEREEAAKRREEAATRNLEASTAAIHSRLTN